MDASLIRRLGQILFVSPSGGEDDLNLRAWFAFFVLYMAGLAALAIAGLDAYEAGSRVGMAVWLLALYLFYMSMCCTFFPAPTTWIVMMMASFYVAEELHVRDWTLMRMVVVAGVGALGTSMANLNEYHIWTFLLRYGKVAGIRKTRLYAVAARWFAVKPFWTIVLFSFIPIPVDVIRWLAITYRYPRAPYFAAYYLGRWVRYACLAGITIWGQLTWWHILIVQSAVAVIALFKIVQKIVQEHRNGQAEAGGGEGDAAPSMPEARQDDIISSPTSVSPDVSNT